MRNLKRSGKFMLGASFAGLVAALAGGQALLHQNIIGSAHAQGGDTMVPLFKADPYWPKPLPNGWIQGMTIGLSADKNDNIWIVHRPGSLEFMESHLTRHESDCCQAAPDILAFDPAGNLIHHITHEDIGLDHDWPSSNHGVTVAPDGTLWTGGNGAPQPGPAPGSAAQFAKKAPGEGGGEKGTYHDSFLLHLTADGKFLGEIGHANGSKGSLDTENVRGVAQIRFLPDGVLVASDGYGNHRVSEWDPATYKNIRIWGAYGKPPSDDPIPTFNSDSPQFGNPVHCVQPSVDGMIYVCDRVNDRVQLFKEDGTFVKQFVLEPATRGDGTIWEIAFSRDPAQKFAFVSDGTDEKIHVMDRASFKELYWFGGGGRMPGQFYAVHSVINDSKSNLYTTETFRGQRVQKWNYQGLKPLSAVLKMGYIGNTKLGAPQLSGAGGP